MQTSGRSVRALALAAASLALASAAGCGAIPAGDAPERSAPLADAEALSRSATLMRARGDALLTAAAGAVGATTQASVVVVDADVPCDLGDTGDGLRRWGYTLSLPLPAARSAAAANSVLALLKAQGWTVQAQDDGATGIVDGDAAYAGELVHVSSATPGTLVLETYGACIGSG